MPGILGLVSRIALERQHSGKPANMIKVDPTRLFGRVRSRLLSTYWELTLGISTTDRSEPVPKVFNYGYVTLPYPTIFAIIRHLALTPTDVFVDLGCGKGRAVCCAALLPIREAIGLEYDKRLCSIAESNALRLRGRRAPISIRNIPAEHWDYTNGTVFYLYNPFDDSVLRAVVAKIASTLAVNPRPTRLAYANPWHEFVLEESGWLEQYDRWAPPEFDGSDHPISFWKSKSNQMWKDGGHNAPLQEIKAT